MTPKEMLAEVMRRATLTDRERESFTDMWDRTHRYGRMTHRQKAWVEKVYFGQKLDQPSTVTTPVTPVVRRRIVIPDWQQKEGRRSQPAKVRQPLAEKRSSSKSGTFMASPQPTEKTHRIGYINYPGIDRETLVTCMDVLHTVCPRIQRGSSQYRKISRFFESGGQVLKVKPAESKVA
jgi:hypothetical protein